MLETSCQQSLHGILLMGCGSSKGGINANNALFTQKSSGNRQSMKLTPTIYYIPEDKVQRFQETNELTDFHRGEEALLEANTHKAFKNVTNDVVKQLENPGQLRT